jgi:hypothetical protein
VFRCVGGVSVFIVDLASSFSLFSKHFQDCLVVVGDELSVRSFVDHCLDVRLNVKCFQG